MQVRIGDSSFDPELRPLVIVRLDVSVRDATMIGAAAKEAISRGGDLVELPCSDVVPRTLEALDDVGVGCVATATCHDELDAVAPQPLAALRWLGSGPLPADVIEGLGQTLLLVGHGAPPPCGDGVVIGPDELETLDRTPEDLIGIVDVSEVSGRAAITTKVTLGLEAGAHGFITTNPSAARRAAHVIRAVEHAR